MRAKARYVTYSLVRFVRCYSVGVKKAAPLGREGLVF